MQRVARSFPGQLSSARQSLGRDCLQTACATQTLPATGSSYKFMFIFKPNSFMSPTLFSGSGGMMM